MDWLLHGLYLILIGMGAGFVQRVSGFGLGIFAMMFLPYFTPTPVAATISTLFSCVTSTYNAIRYRKDIVYKTAIPMVCAALVAIPIAVYFSAVVSAQIFQYLLGGVLILLSIYFLFFNQRVRLKPTLINGVLAGTVGGTLNGLFSTGGPPVVLYLSSALSSNAAYFATIQFYFCFTNIYAMIMRAVNGLLTKDAVIYAAIGLVGCMAGDALGKRVFHKLNGEMLKRIIYIGMIVSGIVMFF